MSKLIPAIFVMLFCAGALAQPVRYEGDTIRLLLNDDGKGALRGEILHQGAVYPLTATGRLDARIQGSFLVKGDSFQFTAQPTPDGLILQTGDKTYRLKRAAAANQVVPSQITFQRVEVRDAQMDNRVSHTMYIPEGWTFKGRTEWSQGTVIYPQQNIEVRSSNGDSVRFLPAMHLSYTEMDPNFAMQLRQAGLWNPQIHQERTGIAPPENIGEFLVEFITRNNQAVSKVRLIGQKRDRDAEAAMQRNLPMIPGTEFESHVVDLGYEEEGKNYHQQIRLIYTRMKPLRGPSGTIWTYSITTGGIVTAPVDRFDQVRPLLNAIANSLTPKPEWHYASQQVLMEIQNARHEANMARIRNWGESIRKAGEDSAKLSDERFRQWKAEQKVDDEKQRERVRNIYDIYTRTTADGSKVAVPLGYDNLYKDKDGKYIASEKPIENNPNLTPVEFGG